MCFENYDCDWTAAVETRSRQTVGEASRCFECHAAIAEGQPRIHIYQSESEGDCLACGEWIRTPDDGDGGIYCDCEDPDRGEIFEGDMCRSCAALRAAIRRQERDEGCPPSAQEPLYCELRLELMEHHSAGDYLRRALRLFPSLESHGLVRSLMPIASAEPTEG